jgi:putative oxidoreductase
MFSFLIAPASPSFLEVGLCIIRVVVGIVTIYFGFPKLMGGPEVWTTVGKNAALMGIHFMPILWGFLSACAQTMGGAALVAGLGTRLACIPLAITMVVAILFHMSKGEGFSGYAFALVLLAVYVGFLLIGSGKISLDYYLWRKTVHPTEYHPLMNRPEDYLK